MKRSLKNFLLAVAVAFLAWLAANAFAEFVAGPAWADQRGTFTRGINHLDDPYQIPFFVYPPWAVLFIAPLSLMPVSLAVLLQMIVYFWTLITIIFRFGGSYKTALIVFTSPLMFNTAFELNIDWIVALGLIVPAVYSGPLLLVKPQVASGYWLGLWTPLSTFMRAAAITIIVLALSFVVWGFWPPDMADAIRRANTLGRGINIAPSALISWPFALVAGSFVAWRAFRYADPVLGVIAGLFFVPYVTLYSLLIPFAFGAIRWPLFAVVFNVVVWALYAPILFDLL